MTETAQSVTTKPTPKTIYADVYARTCAQLKPILLAEDTVHNVDTFSGTKKILYDPAPMQDFLLHLLNEGRVARMATRWAKAPIELPTSARKLGKDETTFKYVDRFRDRAKKTATGLRMQSSHQLTRDEYAVALQLSHNNPLVVRTAAVMQNIVGVYLRGMYRFFNEASKKEQGVVFHAVTLGLIEGAIKAASESFTTELLPYLLLVEKIKESKDIRSRFMAGFKLAVDDQAFKVERKIEGTILQCPFTSGMGRLWSSDFHRTDSGAYILNPLPKPAAFPTLLHGFLQANIDLTPPEPTGP